MARPGISYFDVATAASKLQKDGTRPSIEGIRKELGTGSNSTINRHLRDWREKQENKQPDSEGLPQGLLASVRGLYQSMEEDAAAKIKLEQDKHLQIQKEQEAIIATKDESLVDLEKRYQAQEKQLLDTTKKIDDTITQLNETKAILNKKNDEISLLEARAADKDQAIERLTLQLSHSQRSLEHYRESVRQEREAEFIRHESHANKLAVEIKQLSSANAKLHADLTITLAKLDRANNDVSVITKQVNAKDIENKDLKEKLYAQACKTQEFKLKADYKHNALHDTKSALEKAEFAAVAAIASKELLIQEKTELRSINNNLRSKLSEIEASTIDTSV